MCLLRQAFLFAFPAHYVPSERLSSLTGINALPKSKISFKVSEGRKKDNADRVNEDTWNPHFTIPIPEA